MNTDDQLLAPVGLVASANSAHASDISLTRTLRQPRTRLRQLPLLIRRVKHGRHLNASERQRMQCSIFEGDKLDLRLVIVVRHMPDAHWPARPRLRGLSSHVVAPSGDPVVVPGADVVDIPEVEGPVRRTAAMGVPQVIDLVVVEQAALA